MASSLVAFNLIPRLPRRLCRFIITLLLFNLVLYGMVLLLQMTRQSGKEEIYVNVISEQELLPQDDTGKYDKVQKKRPSIELSIVPRSWDLENRRLLEDKVPKIAIGNRVLNVKRQNVSLVKNALAQGLINGYHWKRGDFCLRDTYNVYWNPLFPDFPASGHFYHALDDQQYVHGLSFRRFLFYLRPPISGNYTFKAIFRDGFDMFLNDATSNSEKLLFTFRSRFSDMKRLMLTTPEEEGFPIESDSVWLTSQKTYFVDIVHSMYFYGKLSVLWRLPGSKEFSNISRRFIFAYSNATTTEVKMPVSYGLSTTDLSRVVSSDPKLDFYKYRPVRLAQFDTGIPTCNYKPPYLIDYKISRFQGVAYVSPDRIFTNHIIYAKHTTPFLSKEIAMNISKEVVSYLNRNNDRRYKLKRLVSVEENRDELTGKRYFVELDLINNKTNKAYRLSEYVYKPKSSGKICLAENYNWNRKSTIYLITVVKNQNKWLKSLIKLVSHTIEATKDDRLHWIIVDFMSKGIDIKKELESNSLKHSLIFMEGKFNKVKALNKAAAKVQDDDSIIFILDLHLVFPLYIFDQIRKHTIKGKTFYCPTLIRLQCGEHPEYTKAKESKWMDQGFGMIASYKQDWDRVGGMNETAFGETWGGEDWEFIDRVIMNQYEVIQHRISGYYHVYHSTKGTWDGTKLY